MRWPLIGTVIEHTGDDPRIVWLVFRADVIALLQIRRRTGFERLSLQRLIAAIGFGFGFVDFSLLFGRQGEKSSSLGEHIGNQIFRNAVIANVEETLVEAGSVQLGADGFSIDEVRARQAADVDHRQSRSGNTYRFERGCHMYLPPLDCAPIAQIDCVQANMMPKAAFRGASRNLRRMCQTLLGGRDAEKTGEKTRQHVTQEQVYQFA